MLQRPTGLENKGIRKGVSFKRGRRDGWKKDCEENAKKQRLNAPKNTVKRKKDVTFRGKTKTPGGRRRKRIIKTKLY